MNKVKNQTDPENFTEDEKPWRPDENELVDPNNRIGQQSIEETESDPVDEALENTLNDDSDPQARDIEISAASVAEAVLFSSDEPITPNKLASIVGSGGVKEIRNIVEQLNTKYEGMGCAFRIESIAGGFQMLTLPEYNVWLHKLIKVRGETKLSPAALETLAIIAYKQPIMRVDIESVRGVAAGEMVRQLIDKGLVKITGRAEELGRPLLYGTTQKFLEAFGLGNLKDLPAAEDLKKPL